MGSSRFVELRRLEVLLVIAAVLLQGWTWTAVKQVEAFSLTPKNRISGWERRHTAGATPAAAATAGTKETETRTNEDAWKKMSLSDLQDLLDTAQRASRAAGSILVENSGCCSHSRAVSVSATLTANNASSASTSNSNAPEIKYNLKDIVTQYDREAQTAIQQVISAAYPDHAFLGEEDVPAGAEASEAALSKALQSERTTNQNQSAIMSSSSTTMPFLWICDPIDGTANFAAGLPLSAVTLACCYHGTPVVGVVYDPHANELFAAIRGRGATRTTANGTRHPLRVADAVTDIRDSIINAGCPADPQAFAASMRGMLALNPRARGLRVVACSALTTAWIAAGRLTAHFGYDLSSWDLVAGALLIQEAGGTVTDLDGSPYRLQTRNMLCSNGNALVHDQILEILRQADAVSFTRATTNTTTTID